MTDHQPWRLVSYITLASYQGWRLMTLACGHVEPWSGGATTPVAAPCTTCYPPTFRGDQWPSDWPINVSAIIEAIAQQLDVYAQEEAPR